MAIDRIPGVGPQNSDIAAAVAAPSAATIASAVAAPSAATIASTVAGSVPTLAQITSAITTNAAPAATTVAAITAAGNSAGWNIAGGQFVSTWTNIGTYTGNDTVSTVTFSGLSSYRFLRFFGLTQFSGSSDILSLRFNGDTSGSYHWGIISSTNSNISAGQDRIRLNPGTVSANNTASSYFVIDGSNSGSHKILYMPPQPVRVGSADAFGGGYGGWRNTSAISTITIFTNGGTVFGGATSFSLQGAI
jgi:hypothetical protein